MHTWKKTNVGKVRLRSTSMSETDFSLPYVCTTASDELGCAAEPPLMTSLLIASLIPPFVMPPSA